MDQQRLMAQDQVKQIQDRQQLMLKQQQNQMEVMLKQIQAQMESELRMKSELVYIFILFIKFYGQRNHRLINWRCTS